MQGTAMKEEIRVRTATRQDAEALLQIYAPYVKNTAITFEYDVPTVEEFAGRIDSVLTRYPYLIAEISGEPAGYAYAGPFSERAAYDWSVETTVYVREDMKRQGIGRTLYEALEEALAKQGILNLNAYIAYHDEEDRYLTKDSVRFHERMGYSLVGHSHKCGCKFGRWYDMVWMDKSIGEHVDNPPEVRALGDYCGYKDVGTSAVNQHHSRRLEEFEKMLSEVHRQYYDIEIKMEEMKAEGREKTSTYCQLMANKLRLGDMLAMYKLYDLL